MQAYRTSTKLKLGLIAAAVAIGVASLLFTQRLADRLEAQDAAAVDLWAEAIEFQARANLSAQGAAPWDDLAAAVEASGRPAPERARLVAALDSLRDGPPSDGLDFVFSEIVEPARFSVPAVVTDEAMTAVSVARNVPDEGADLLALARAMDAVHDPIPIEITPGFVQLVHYGESPLARLIRLFPVVQLAVVALFILVGYLGFSYVRRSEQSSLWVGMAREAAHQLGTPLSSMIGWVELLRLGDSVAPETVADELEQDVERLRRVADRFEKIGTTPDLTPTALGPVLDRVADYIRRRVPTSAPATITVDVAPGLAAPLNADLFEWVIENLLKNALDAMAACPARTGSRSPPAPRAGRSSSTSPTQARGWTGRRRATCSARVLDQAPRWGLGLSLARRIVESYHGGSLAVRATEPGEGTTFRITLAGGAE